MKNFSILIWLVNLFKTKASSGSEETLVFHSELEIYQLLQQSIASIFRQITWRFHPLKFEDPFMTFCTDDKIIVPVLNQLGKVLGNIPTLQDFKNASGDSHFLIINYQKTFNLYWFHYCNVNEKVSHEDTGFILYQFTDFITMPFNFLEYSRMFKLPDESITNLYQHVDEQLSIIIKTLELPIRYNLILSTSFIGFQLN